MDDTIYRQAAIDEIKALYEWHDTVTEDRTIDHLKRLPSAQPEIIHCRECRWQKDQSGSTAWLPCRASVTPPDFYCGRAERRTNGED